MISVVDSGICNLASLLSAFEAVGRPATPARDPEDLRRAERVVLPGVGGFAAAMESLRQRGFDEAVAARARDEVPILGICLGMQLVAETGTEGGVTSGLGLVEARVTQLDPGDSALRVPHVGWNNFTELGGNRLLEAAELGPDPDFYFVHSYRLEPSGSKLRTSMVDYGRPFVGAFDAGRVFGCQFHPELSHHNGLKVLKAFADIQC